MTRSERAMLLFLLAMCAGSADGWSFLGFGDVFVANMTGNTVLLGISFFGVRGGVLRATAGSFGYVLHPALGLVAYAVGVVIASYVTGKGSVRMKNAIWTRSVTWLLVAETLCAAAVECAWYVYHGSGQPLLVVLMMVLAMCMGMQSGAMLQLRVPGIVTTYITGTWTTMMRGLTRVVAGERLEMHEPKREFEEGLAMQAVTLSVYLLSAVITGWLFEEAPRLVGVIPVACLATASVWAMLRGGACPVADEGLTD